jgi:hypothetical protein
MLSASTFVASLAPLTSAAVNAPIRFLLPRWWLGGRGLIEHNLSLACLEPDGERKILAGVNRMPWPHFMLANIIGACLCASRLAAYSLGRQVERLAGWMVFVFGPPPFLC